MSFIRSHPFSSPVGQRIERATSESQASEDWGLIMEVTDIINETEEGAKDAVKALKKRLFGNKKWKEVMFSLTVLETCVKNCQHRFHVLICKQEFCKELVKVIQPNNNPPTIVQEKILGLIQSWADAFKNDPTLHGVVKVYEELKSKSIEFPPTDLDALSPIRTPQRITPEIDPAMNIPAPTRQPTAGAPQAPQAHAPVHAPAPTHAQQAPPPPSQAPAVTPEQMTKLRRELDIVLGNVRVMSEMLTEMQPGQENPDDLQLLQELNQTCRAMQMRVVELLSEVTHEEVTGELLRVNDDLNNMFVRYDRYERYRQSHPQRTQQAQSVPAQAPLPAMAPAIVPAAVPVTAQAPSQGESNTGTLIDFGDEGPAPVPGPGPTAAPYPVAAGTAAPPYSVGPGPNTAPYPAGPGSNTAPYPAGPGANTAPYPTGPGANTAPYPGAPMGGAMPTMASQQPAQSSLTDQLAGLTMTGGSVSGTLGQISNVPTSVNPPPPEDDFDMFAQSRGVSYQDSMRSGSTYQDNTNVDQAGGALAGYVQNRPNAYPPPSQSAAAPAPATATGQGGLDDVEQWLTENDLAKPEDSYAAANTNPAPAGDPGITSTEFDKFLQERAKVGDTLPTAQAGSHSNVTAPATNQQNRQMQMNETENSMFAL